MNSPSFTSKAFGIYVIAVSIPLILTPNLFLGLLGFPLAHEIWVRVLGLVGTILGYYYVAAGLGNARPFVVASVYGRFAFCAGCVGLVVLVSAPWQLLLFGAVDVAGALWTFFALRYEAAAQPGVMCPEKRNVPVAERGSHLVIVTDEKGDTRVQSIESEYTFAFELRQAARVMNNSAHATEEGPSTHWHLRAFIHGSIILSYASLEAALNEIIHLNAFEKDSPLTEAERQVFYTIGQEGLQPRESSNTLQQYNMLLRILGKPEMDPGASPYQAANLVRKLRNMLIHPIPGRVTTFVEAKDFDYSSQQDIVKKLKPALGLKTDATFPIDVLTKVCAKWAVHSCETFLHEFVKVSGIDPGFITDPNHARKAT